MIIKGYLTEISFVELLKIISKHDGRLGIWNFEDKIQYECFFFDKKVVYFNVNKWNITDIAEIKKVVLEICADKKSYYAFQSNVEVPNFTEPVTTVEQLLNFSLSHNENEENIQSNLPNLQTKFETVNKVSFPVEGELEQFWNETVNILHQGCSGREICDQFNYSEKEVREALYKLRTIGLIKPFRAFKFNNSSQINKAFDEKLNRSSEQINGVKPEIQEESQTEVLVASNTENNNEVQLSEQNILAVNENTQQNVELNFCEQIPGNPTPGIFQKEIFNDIPPPPSILVPVFTQQIETPQFQNPTPFEINVSNFQESSELLSEPDYFTAQNDSRNENTVELINEDIQEFTEIIDLPNRSPKVHQETFEEKKIVKFTEPYKENKQKYQSSSETINLPTKTGLVRRMLNSLFR